jgi:hypothetical protein
MIGWSALALLNGTIIAFAQFNSIEQLMID